MQYWESEALGSTPDSSILAQGINHQCLCLVSAGSPLSPLLMLYLIMYGIRAGVQYRRPYFLAFQGERGTCVSSVQPLSHVRLCEPMDYSMPGLPVHHQLPNLTQTHAHRVSDAILTISSVASFSSCPQSFPASGPFPMSQLFIRWPKYWSFSFSINPSNEYSGLISFRMD